MTISDMALSTGGRGTAGRHAGAPRKEEHTQMKIKALANYCKQTKSVVLLDQYDESGVLQRQYVQAGSAVFPLDGLPLLNEDTLIAILDIPVKGAKHRGVRTAAQPLRNPEACTP